MKRALVVEGVGVSHVAGLGGRGDAVGGQQQVATLHADRPIRGRDRVDADRRCSSLRMQS